MFPHTGEAGESAVPWTGKVRPNTSMTGQLKKYSLNMVVSMVADMRMMRTSGYAWTTSLRTTMRKSVCMDTQRVRHTDRSPRGVFGSASP